ncbi:hypothetical protein RF11_14334 [Thelohanellus kitauei]|uniref:Uncharacterized protein n=1 Tax=Thelohanellus kitauei TaxID=669202 RepID=A0A0C2MTV7_THEKT|nr:hypothetical protein RF11_14334 [Thelohanellus kitauei]
MNEKFECIFPDCYRSLYETQKMAKNLNYGLYYRLSNYFGRGNNASKVIYLEKSRNYGGKFVILIYGFFYNETLFAGLEDGRCPNSNGYTIIRSNTCVYHDAVILHFMEYIIFLEKCEKYTYLNKKILVIFSMVFL